MMNGQRFNLGEKHMGQLVLLAERLGVKPGDKLGELDIFVEGRAYSVALLLNSLLDKMDEVLNAKAELCPICDISPPDPVLLDRDGERHVCGECWLRQRREDDPLGEFLKNKPADDDIHFVAVPIEVVSRVLRQREELIRTLEMAIL